MWSRAENFNLTPTHAYGPNSQAFMKNMSSNILKDVNLHQFEKRKFHVMERVNEYRTSLTRNLRFLLFLTRKALGRRSCLTKHFLGLGPRDVQGCFRFRYRIVWNVFGHLWTSTEVLGKRRICLCRLRKSWYSPVKNLTPLTQKKLAGILTGRWSLTRS